MPFVVTSCMACNQWYARAVDDVGLLYSEVGLLYY